MNRKIRWGILSTGWIADKFVRDLKLLSAAQIVAVGSRSRQSADRFGDRFDIPYRFGSYAELAACSEVDVVFIGTPHPFHKDNAILCLNAGKAVLCEKPFALNKAESEEMVAAARANRVFLMEAMWSRFTPMFQQVKRWITGGKIGAVRLLQSDYGMRSGNGPEHRLFNPDLGGGALLDIGIYPVSLASFVFNEQPSKITSSVHLGKTGVDEQAALLFEYADERTAQLFSAITLNTRKESIIFGTQGSIHIYGPWWQLRKLRLTIGEKSTEKEFNLIGSGYAHEALEVMNCLREERLESSIMPLQESLAIMETQDRIRAQWGLRYPTEKLPA